MKQNHLCGNLHVIFSDWSYFELAQGLVLKGEGQAS